MNLKIFYEYFSQLSYIKNYVGLIEQYIPFF